MITLAATSAFSCLVFLSAQAPVEPPTEVPAEAPIPPSGEAPAQVPSPPALAAGPDLSALAKALKKSVVGIEVDLGKGGAQGSGFIIRDDGWIVTNHHVIKGANEIFIHTDGGEKVEVVGIVAQSEEVDLAILKIDRQGLSAITLGSSESAVQGSRVVILGNPVGLGFSLSEGIVAAVRENGIPNEEEKRASWKQKLLQTTAPISPGSSGSPAVNLAREVVGVAMGVNTGGQNLNFLVPVERLQEMIDRVQQEALAAGNKPGVTPLAPVSEFPVVNLVASVGFFAFLGIAWFFLTRRSSLRRKGKPVGKAPPANKGGPNRGTNKGGPKNWVH